MRRCYTLQDSVCGSGFPGVCPGPPPPKAAGATDAGGEKRPADHLPGCSTQVCFACTVFFPGESCALCLFPPYRACLQQGPHASGCAPGARACPAPAHGMSERALARRQFVNETFYFERTRDSYAVVRNGAERPPVPSTQLPPMVTSLTQPTGVRRPLLCPTLSHL